MSEIVTLALNLARNCGYSVFPVGENKTPAIPGPGGYKHASREREEIARLWREHPGPLIGIATGALSGVSVLDVDQKHHEAWEWWQHHCQRVLPSRVYETRSGGIHIYMRDPDGAVPSTTSRICKGVDTRGQGGYVVSWFAAGFACHDHSPPVPWPQWLIDALKPPRPAEPSQHHNEPTEASLIGIVRRVAAAQEGERNAILFWAACRLAERNMRQSEIESVLLPAAREAGLSDIEARRSITSAGRVAA